MEGLSISPAATVYPAPPPRSTQTASHLPLAEARGSASSPQRAPRPPGSRSQRHSGQGDGCGGGVGRRSRSSGGGIWHAESVAAKGPILTSPSRTPPADRPRTAGLKTHRYATPAHWPLGRPQVRLLGTAAAITRATSAIRRLRPERGCRGGGLRVRGSAAAPPPTRAATNGSTSSPLTFPSSIHVGLRPEWSIQQDIDKRIDV